MEDNPVLIEDERARLTFDFPYKTFLLNEIDVSLENLPVIAMGVLEYMGKTYKILKITPKTFVAGAFLFYQFDCVEKVRELGTELRDDGGLEESSDIYEEPA